MTTHRRNNRRDRGRLVPQLWCSISVFKNFPGVIPLDPHSDPLPHPTLSPAFGRARGASTPVLGSKPWSPSTLQPCLRSCDYDNDDDDDATMSVMTVITWLWLFSLTHTLTYANTRSWGCEEVENRTSQLPTTSHATRPSCTNLMSQLHEYKTRAYTMPRGAVLHATRAPAWQFGL